ncbi:uncharacterized protein [Triticum aestivum]|uniref:uncharacterized protein n=1 Tax=Triticum aestivum TaxID=4565 RepID=UPI001D015DAB|nr:uncharacterized protein LOC123188940 [Triticum aestivum]
MAGAVPDPRGYALELHRPRLHRLQPPVRAGALHNLAIWSSSPPWPPSFVVGFVASGPPSASPTAPSSSRYISGFFIELEKEIFRKFNAAAATPSLNAVQKALV